MSDNANWTLDKTFKFFLQNKELKHTMQCVRISAKHNFEFIVNMFQRLFETPAKISNPGEGTKICIEHANTNQIQAFRLILKKSYLATNMTKRTPALVIQAELGTFGIFEFSE